MNLSNSHPRISTSVKLGDAKTFYSHGKVRLDKGDLEGALQDFSEAIRLKPDNAQAFNNRGGLDGAQHDFHEAVRLELKP